MTTTNIHNRFDPAKNFDSILFRQDKVLQSAELNELQSMATHRLRGVTDALFKDGDVIRDARLIIDPDTGAAQAQAGAIYLQGTVRGVPPATLAVPTVGVVQVGMYLLTASVTELEDPSLLNPATGTPAFQEPGAWRRQVQPAWGVEGDGQAGDFYPVWTVEDGYVRGKEPPPNLDAVTQALARYDRDSAGDGYIVSGLTVATAPHLPTGEQVYTVAEGRARVNGYGVQQAASRRLVYATAPDLMLIDSEAHYSAGVASQRISVHRPPMRGAPQVRIQARRTVDVVHGGFSGAADALPDSGVIAIDTVKQGATTYSAPADYKLTAGQVDWSAAGAEPAPGSTYQVTFTYMKVAEPANVTPEGFDVTGALEGTMVLVTYEQMLRRIDRLCLDAQGAYHWVRGISAQWTPTPPSVPPGLLLLASIYQSWDAARRVVPDGVRVVTMTEIAGHGLRLDALTEDQAELRLAVDVSGRDSGIRKGLFADPFVSDAMRDAGVAQTGAIVGGALRLPLQVAVHQVGAHITSAQSVAHGYKAVVQQGLRTGAMAINPYQSFRPLPATATLAPNVDRWTEVNTQWTSPVTERLYTGSGSLSSYGGTSTSTHTLSSSSTQIEHLREIAVRFELGGFAPGEALGAVTFDGIATAAQPLADQTLVASAAGTLAGSFTIPPGVPAGTKEVVFAGTGGSTGVQYFTGQGTTELHVQQQVSTERWNRYDAPPPVVSSGGGGFVVGPGGGSGSAQPVESKKCNVWEMVLGYDPLAQTFMLDAASQVAGVDLLFTAAHSDVIVQIRDTQVGMPSSQVLVQQSIAPAAIVLGGGATRITWPPVLLQAGREYALVLICNDPDTAVSVAELGKGDLDSGRWVTSQPYQVGVLLSSSNASTWTAHQDKDLTFWLLAAQYTQAERVIELGSAAVQGATDLMVLGYADRPDSQAAMALELEFSSGQRVQLNDGQVIWLAEPYTGDVQVRARLSAGATMGAVLQPGVQLVAGALASTGDYVTRWLNAGGASSRVKVIFQAEIPSGSAVHVHAQTDAPGAPWTLVPYVSASDASAGVREFIHELTGVAGNRVRVRITLTGSTTARPAVGNLRAVVL